MWGAVVGDTHEGGCGGSCVESMCWSTLCVEGGGACLGDVWAAMCVAGAIFVWGSTWTTDPYKQTASTSGSQRPSRPTKHEEPTPTTAYA